MYREETRRPMKVPFVDLQAQYHSLRAEILPGIENVMEHSAFILGDDVDQFEREFAAYCGNRACVAVASGCDALLFALKACGIGPGDEVITVANTFIASALAISACGATPVLVDCREDTYEIDPQQLRQAVTPRTKAVLPVHLYGQAADFEAIATIAREFHLKVIEDACQAHGATYQGKPCGALGDVGCFSFYPGKNLGAYGDGGALVTDDPEIVQRARMYRNYGQSQKYCHEVIGWNSRLDTLQAAILRVKLRHLSDWNAARRAHAAAYAERLRDLPALVLPAVGPGNEHVYHLFVVRVRKRDELLEFLKQRGVFAGVHYPVPIHLQRAYAGHGWRQGQFPVTERLAREIVSLPMYPELTEAQIDHVCASVREFLQA
jgi:dTDP-4-amino-4,6-dideoxygalactose transaminase